LEKQLRIQEDGEIIMKDSKDQISTTPSSISKDLYERVLNKATGGTFLTKNRFSSSFSGKTTETEVPKPDNKYSSVVRNSRPGPQNSGLEKLPEFDAFLKDKPKYTTINRQRPENIAETIEAALKKEKPDDEYEYEDVEEDKAAKITTTTQGSTQYVNIRRQRPTTVFITTTSKPDLDEDYDYEPSEEEVKTTSKPVVQNKFASSRRTTTEKSIVTTNSNR
jgi:chitinase